MREKPLTNLTSKLFTACAFIAALFALTEFLGQQDSAQIGLSTDYGAAILGVLVALGCAWGAKVNRFAKPEELAPPVPPGTNPARWAPDPSGQYRLRWWDGQRWTDDTQD